MTAVCRVLSSFVKTIFFVVYRLHVTAQQRYLLNFQELLRCYTSRPDAPSYSTRRQTNSVSKAVFIRATRPIIRQWHRPPATVGVRQLE